MTRPAPYISRSIHSELDRNELVFMLDYIHSKYPITYSSAINHLNAYLEYITNKTAMWMLKHEFVMNLSSTDSDTDDDNTYDSPTPYRPPRDLTAQVDDLTLQ